MKGQAHERRGGWALPLLAMTIWMGAATVVRAQNTEASGPPITIGVSPPRFELDIGKGPVNESLRVFNFGTEPARIRVNVHDWTLDEANQVQLVPPSEQSLEQWLIINPVAFELPPGEVQTVRFSVRPKVQPIEGEHRAIVYLEQEPRVIGTGSDGEPMRVVGKLGVAIYGYAGEVSRRGQLHGLQVDAERSVPTARFDLSSLGNAHVRLRGHYAIWPAGTYPGATETIRQSEEQTELALPDGALEVGQLPQMPVLPDSRRTILVSGQQPLPPGNYVLDVNGEIAGEAIDVGIPFAVTAPEPSAVGASR